jgi:hypothetical protein
MQKIYAGWSFFGIAVAAALGGRLSRDEMVAMVFLLLIAGKTLDCVTG